MTQNLFPRWTNIVLGGWLIVSAFLWLHTAEQFANSWIVGFAAIIAAVSAIRFDRARYVNAALALWLFLSAWILPVISAGTFWNNLIVAVVMFIAALTSHAPRRELTTGSTEMPRRQRANRPSHGLPR